MIKAARRDRVSAHILRAVLAMLAVNMFVKPMFTNIPVVTATMLPLRTRKAGLES